MRRDRVWFYAVVARWGRLVSVIAVAFVALTSGCAPSDDFDPVAVQAPGGVPLIKYTSCSPVSVARAEIIQPRGQVVDDRDPRLWSVEFRPAASVQEVGPAKVPSGAAVTTQWTPPGNAKDVLDARLTLTNGATVSEDFTLDAVQNGATRYQDRTLSAADFSAATRCGASGS